MRALVALSPPGLPRVDAIRIDGAGASRSRWRVTTLVGLVVGFVSGARAPREPTCRTDCSKARGAPPAVHRRRAQRARRRRSRAGARAAGQRGAAAAQPRASLRRVAPGFDPSHLLTMQVVESGHTFRTATARPADLRSSARGGAAVPGVTSRGLHQPVAAERRPRRLRLRRADRRHRSTPGDQRFGAALCRVAGYFATMRIPLRRGRLLDAHDCH